MVMNRFYGNEPMLRYTNKAKSISGRKNDIGREKMLYPDQIKNIFMLKKTSCENQ